MTERLFFLAKNLFKSNKCKEQLYKFKKQFKPFTNRFGQFVLYSAAFYNWDDQCITDQEINNTINEFVFTSKVFFDQRSNRKQLNSDRSTSKKINKSSFKNELLKDEWEAVLIKENYQVWKKKLDNRSGLYRYKVFGTFDDIPAKTFLNVQMDTEYRKKWDSLIVKLNILDKEKHNEQINFNKSLNDIGFVDTGNEVLQWVMKYPYPMYSREYCFIRRAIVSQKENLIVLISKSCDHPKCKEQSDSSSVRVTDYESQMVIKPHTTFDDNGFDYLLTYFDDPRAYLPSTCSNWVTSSGLPGFVDNLHVAALELNKKIIKNNKSNSSTTSNKTTTKSNLKKQSSSSSNSDSFNDLVYN